MNLNQAPFNNSVLFAQNDLSQIPGIMIYDYKTNSLPRREINKYKLARQDRSITTSAEFVDKEIIVRFLLKECTNEEMEQTLLQLKSLLVQKNQPLTIQNAGMAITYTATMKDIPEPEWIGRYMGSVIIFDCPDPFGYEENKTTLINENNTLSAVTIPVAVEGSYTAEPRFTLTLNSLTDGISKTISLRNSTTGQGITVIDTFVAGDIITIDSANKSVRLNNVEVPYSGKFPSFYPGSGSVTYSDTFTTRDVDIFADYNKRIM